MPKPDAAVKLTPNRDVQAMAALALARAGDTAAGGEAGCRTRQDVSAGHASPEVLVAHDPGSRRFAAQRPEPGNRTAASGEHNRARRDHEVNVFCCPVYLRGEAYLMLHDGKAAAAEFQKFVDHYGLVGNFPWAALARLGLARAYALCRQRPCRPLKANTAYQDFLTIWKDADPDVPILKEAKAEYAKLE